MQDTQETTLPRINVGLVHQLIALQFPQWVDLDLTPVVPGGWENRTFQLGDDKLVRLPSAKVFLDTH